MTVDEYIKFFQAIPEDKWCTRLYHRGEKSCAIGHLTRAYNTDASLYDFLCLDLVGATVVQINDGLTPLFKQATPKKRILAALREAKRKNEKN